jgi:integrase
MPRKPKQEKQTMTVVVNGTPVSVVLHPPTGRRTSWYAYWAGLVASKSTGQRKLEDAIVVAESMVKNGGKQATMADALMTDDEFKQIQRVHFARRLDQKAKARAEKSLKACLEAIDAFKTISTVKAISRATADDCAAFQRKALTYAKDWRHKHPNSKQQIECLSPSTVKKWLGALQAAFERANRNAGKKCVRGVVDEHKLLTENPWKQFTWLEGRTKPIRQFDGDELLSLLDYFETHWKGITAGPLVAKVCLWSWCRREEVMSLQWSMLRVVGNEFHFEIEGKRGIRKWFRLPNGLFNELLKIKTENAYVFAAYSQQIRNFFENSETPGPAKNVETEYKPENLGNWFYKKLLKWSESLPKGKATTHVFRKTSLQYARAGEDVNRQVASDARLGEDVMMTHYVQESDVQMRHASNRTFDRILASLPPAVAARYGHVEPKTSALEKRLDEARVANNWELVAQLSKALASRGRCGTG